MDSNRDCGPMKIQPEGIYFIDQMLKDKLCYDVVIWDLLPALPISFRMIRILMMINKISRTCDMYQRNSNALLLSNILKDISMNS